MRKTTARSRKPARPTGIDGKTKMQRYRSKLRAQGLRPIQVWVPDVNAPGFAAAARAQSLLAAHHDDKSVMDFIEAATADLWED